MRIIAATLAVACLSFQASAASNDACQKGLAATDANAYDDAIAALTTCLDDGIASEKFRAAILYARAWAYVILGQTDDALTDHDAAADLDPDPIVAHSLRGYIRQQSGDYAGAIRDFGLVVKLASESHDAYLSRADAYAVSGNFGLAILDYDRAIRLKPNNTVAYVARGQAYYDRGIYNGDESDIRRAIEDYGKALAWNRMNGEAFYQRSLAYRRLGDEVQANRDLARAFALGVR